MGRLKKFVSVQPEPDLPPPPEIDLSKAGLESDRDDFGIISWWYKVLPFRLLCAILLNIKCSHDLLLI